MWQAQFIEGKAKSFSKTITSFSSRHCILFLATPTMMIDVRKFANCTHIIVSLLKAWKVTMVGIECDVPPFNIISRNSYQKLFFQEKIFFSKFCKQGGKLDYSRYSQVSLLTLCYHWQTLRNGDFQIFTISLCNTTHTFF